MAENSKIEWTVHTWNPWMGCTEVGPPCDRCYARVMMDERYGKVRWGAGSTMMMVGKVPIFSPTSTEVCDNWKRK